MSDELESALAELTTAREKFEAVRASLVQVLDIPHDDQAVVRQTQSRLERIDAEVAGVERLMKSVASQVVGDGLTKASYARLLLGPRPQSVEPEDLGGGIQDLARVVSGEEITVHDLPRGRVGARDDVHSVAPGPDGVHPHRQQVPRPAEGSHHLPTDCIPHGRLLNRSFLLRRDTRHDPLLDMAVGLPHRR
ncbi:hypothetical protein [Paludisphaera mucosa]|uniref:Uncharacterized protein n=1 Tax=Paludisphaera mucosa TaxID=3030827 RepID=A0ABT6FEG6_9BACT|nr:hypothetical protein [Paludisphaera mucosa]MDG3005978.1 hypothetical protein [Paludisphaera mucosa]